MEIMEIGPFKRTGTPYNDFVSIYTLNGSAQSERGKMVVFME